jgi:hypothetical protein
LPVRHAGISVAVLILKSACSVREIRRIPGELLLHSRMIDQERSQVLVVVEIFLADYQRRIGSQILVDVLVIIKELVQPIEISLGVLLAHGAGLIGNARLARFSLGPRVRGNQTKRQSRAAHESCTAQISGERSHIGIASMFVASFAFAKGLFVLSTKDFHQRTSLRN